MLNGFLKQSTASQSVIIGPFLDDTDFITPETALSIANTDIKLMKNAAAAVSKNSGGGTHRNQGGYSITLDATDTNTVGELCIMVNKTGALPVIHKFQVVEEFVYAGLFASAAKIDVSDVTGDVNGDLIGDVQGSVLGSVASVVASVTATDPNAITGTVVDRSGTETTAHTDLDTGAHLLTTNDILVGRAIRWLTGPLIGQIQPIEAYNGSTGEVTFSEGPVAPGNSDTFEIV